MRWAVSRPTLLSQDGYVGQTAVGTHPGAGGGEASAPEERRTLPDKTSRLAKNSATRYAGGFQEDMRNVRGLIRALRPLDQARPLFDVTHRPIPYLSWDTLPATLFSWRSRQQ